MQYHKVPHAINFSYPDAWNPRNASARIAGRTYGLRLDDFGGGVTRLTVKHACWPKQYSQAVLTPERVRTDKGLTALGADGTLTVRAPDGTVLLEGIQGRTFGVDGQGWVLQFHHEADMRFYGMGEKNIGFERSGRQTHFWNTDVVADFNSKLCQDDVTDPMYVSIPYVIVKRGNRYMGILMNNPFASFASVRPGEHRCAAHGGKVVSNFFVGAPDGVPEVYFLVGPSLAELTRKLQALVGKTPMPPLWALGHQQCRWGYRNYADLDGLAKQFKKHGIPNDGLWLDIDYMRGYRVFTVDSKHFPKLRKQLADLEMRGHKVVPILDPGVKDERGYDVYEDGRKNRVFCEREDGSHFVGFVWPGDTVFPDYSLPKVRAWWAKWSKKFFDTGFGGAWLDMNDPAVGRIALDPMRFEHGRAPHEMYHNQYAFGMAQASNAGFRAAKPNLRPFLLARSGFISTNRYAAVWTGDNRSNWFHLGKSIEVSTNLALSGIPFNGPDVPGFGGNATKELAVAWYKAGFLFPFFRNHSSHHTRDQEPWQFGAQATRIIGHYIRLRYKLLPYLYNLFVRQEETGEAILRPLFHDFEDTAELPLDRVGDQFMMGPALMQAPVLAEGQMVRDVVLPGATWFDAAEGRWIRGGRRVRVKTTAATTPIYIREGSLVPMLCGEPKNNRSDLSRIELHVFLKRGGTGRAEYRYVFDDGETLDYAKGKRTEIVFAVEQRGGVLTVAATASRLAYKPCRVSVVVYGDWKVVKCVTGGRVTLMATKPMRWTIGGTAVRCRRTVSELRVG